MEADMIPTVYPTPLFEARRNSILEAYRSLTPEQQRNVIAELAEMEACDPDKCDVPTPPVSEQDDERNSRPFPF
jgi:hypothetical protein